ncbi:NAD kinase [Gracilibacillus caseinilyticus]|uniref:NAD kinase n=1 Tax=Gracilibacillus caseinilyticus TaxID=2932256 RepID=A0ABY4ETE1_9BACI|nr:NAD kinase [Gracilibacillus caseinilyticus]UOQ47142.1 NAD kinase [Gracilibacillus caseinilyticus]
MDKRRNIFFYYKKQKDISNKLEILFQYVRDQGFEVVEESKEANIIISIGGDGEFLQAVRNTNFRQDCLYVGMTQADESGLYCDFNLDEYSTMIEAVKEENIEVRRFPTIDVNINGRSTFHCLNEATIRSAVIKTIVMDVYIDDNFFERFRGDGLIVATPTGSTGYNKSTRGAVIDPKIPCFQVTELASLNNNRYRTLGSSFILNKDRTLRLEVVQDGNDYPIVGLDNEAYSIRNIKSLTMQLSDKRIKTVKLKNNSFWDRVQRTFL